MFWILPWLLSRFVAELLSGESDCYSWFKMFHSFNLCQLLGRCYKLEIQQYTRQETSFTVSEVGYFNSMACTQTDNKMFQLLVSAMQKVKQGSVKDSDLAVSEVRVVLMCQFQWLGKDS